MRALVVALEQAPADLTVVSFGPLLWSEVGEFFLAHRSCWYVVVDEYGQTY